MRYFNLSSASMRAAALLLSLLVLGLPASAVTDQEMEQARTITAQTYLRYANDGSGYLDDLHPTTMSALQKSLKEKEKENLKAFQAVPVPKDYASWGKDELVKFWSVTFFKSQGLSEKGKIGKTRVKSRLLRMNVTPPAKKEEPKKEEPKKEETPKPEEAQAAPAVPDELASPSESRADSLKRVQEAGAEAQAERLKEMEAKADSLEAMSEESIADEAVPKRQSSTWIYVVILCVLVAIVVALVFFASSTMKKNRLEDYSDETPEGRNRRKQLEGEIRAEEAERAAQLEARQAKALDKARSETEAAATAAREAIAAADEERARAGEALREVEALRKRVQSAEQEALAMRAERDALAEKARMLEESLQKMAARQKEQAAAAVAAPAKHVDTASVAAPAPAAAQAEPAVASAAPASVRPEPRPEPRAEARAEARPDGRPEVRKSKIYLGRVNSRGLFVRADRGLNLESSVYVLETEDGFSGSYRVVRNREVWARLLEDPEHWLEKGCIIRDEDTDEDVTSVVTESPGTAVFENSCWRVIRKAKVRFE